MVDKITPAGMPGLGLIEAKTSNYGVTRQSFGQRD